MRLVRMPAAAMAVVVLAVAGCGGGDSSSTTSTAAALTKQQFVDQANQICAEGNKQIQAAAKDVFANGKPSKSEFTDFVNNTLIPSVQDQVDQIDALPAPSGDQDQVDAIVNAVNDGLDKAKQDPMSMASSKTDPFAEANKLSVDYGLTVCGGNG